MKPLKMAINLFFFKRPFRSQDFFMLQTRSQRKFLIFDVGMTQEISKGEIGNEKQLGIINYSIFFKNNFNLLVMNVKQIIFFTEKSAYTTLN